jgi:predicted enzyme related to lactoylglutathione lyase
VTSTVFDLVTIDSPDPDGIARFWSAALDLVEVEREDVDRWIVLADRHGTRRLGIQRGEARAGTVHLDLACAPEQFDTELVRLVALGAREVGAPRRESYGSIVNLADPDGNPFDLCAYA